VLLIFCMVAIMIAYLLITLFYEIVIQSGSRENIRKWKRIHVPHVETVKRKKHLNKKAIINVSSLLLLLVISNNFMFTLIVAAIYFSVEYLLAINTKKSKRKHFMMQFKDFLVIISTSLKAGDSLSSAIMKSERDMERMHGEKRARPMLEEVKQMKKEIELGYDVKTTLKRFKLRANLSEVSMFVDSVMVVYEMGGNLNDIISKTSKSISEKMEIKREIEVQTSEKKFEANLLTMLPIVFMAIIFVMSPNYYDQFLSNIIGKILLVVAVMLVVLNYFISRKIVDIQV